MNASPLAPMMLLIWPVVVFALFGRTGRANALIWSLLGGYLLLPPVVAIDLPVMPALDKDVIPAISAALVLAFRQGATSRPPPMGAMLRLLMAIMICSPLLTALTNGDPLVEGVSVRPGQTMSEGIAGAILAGFGLLPFILGFRVLSEPASARRLVVALCGAMLAYSLPMLVEIRLSPQLNAWIYGFFPHEFQQTMRYGGFRPVVFLQHPLWLAFMTLCGLIAALTLRRTATAEGKPNGVWTLAALYLAVMLVLVKSAGVLLLAAGALPALLFLPPRLIARGALFAGLLVCLYPVARGALPLAPVVAAVQTVSPERAQSLNYRLENEDLLLARALEKPLFGWGPWGRHLVVDPVSGRYVTVADGRWILALGKGGFVLLTAEFGLLVAALAMLARSVQHAARRDLAMPLAGLAVILALNMIDLLPNATLTPITWLVAGTVAGNAARLRTQPADGASPPALPETRIRPIL